MLGMRVAPLKRRLQRPSIPLGFLQCCYIEISTEKPFQRTTYVHSLELISLETRERDSSLLHNFHLTNRAHIDLHTKWEKALKMQRNSKSFHSPIANNKIPSTNRLGISTTVNNQFTRKELETQEVICNRSINHLPLISIPSIQILFKTNTLITKRKVQK